MARLTPSLLVLLGLGCSELPPGPELVSVEPSEVLAGRDSALRVEGRNLRRRVKANLDDPAKSEVSASYELHLVSGDARVALDSVRLVDEDAALEAILKAGAAEEGLYSLELTDPWGRRAQLADALAVRSECLVDGDCRSAPACRAARCLDGRCDDSRALEDGAACDDGDGCTHADSCAGGRCRGIDDCGNTAPLACFTVEPTAGPVTEPFRFDAACSSDREDPPERLEARFDFEGSGAFTPFEVAKVATHRYADAGLYLAVLEVRDDAGVSAFASRYVGATASGAELIVTTPLDEDDPGATALQPGGTGLSLREAIRLANASGQAVIRFDGGMRLEAAVLPAITGPGTVVFAHGASIDFAQGADAGLTDCLQLDGPGVALIGLEAFNCAGHVVQLKGGARVAECRFHPGPRGGLPPKLGGPGATFGPRNEVFGFSGAGIEVKSSDVAVLESSLHHNGRGIDVTASFDRAVIRQNVVWANAGPGMVLGRAGHEVLHNTVHGNAGDGVLAGPVTQGAVVRNNLFTSNGGFGVNAPSAGLAADRGPNGFHGNPPFPLATDGGAGQLLADPRYAAPGGGDFRLLPMSPAINAGVDLGLDVNGPAPGRYGSSGPDLGARESPYPDAG